MKIAINLRCFILRSKLSSRKTKEGEVENVYAGFTIVELLIVIVVIGILAAITIVAYNGIQDRAHASSAQVAAHSVAGLLGAANATNGNYPNDLLTINNGHSLSSSDGTSYAYHPGNGNTSYCVTVTNGKSSFKVTDTSSAPVSGGCPGDGTGGVVALTNLSINPSVETDISNWQAPFSPNNIGIRDTSLSFSGAASFKASRTAAYGDTRMARYAFINHPTGQYVFSASVYVNDAAIGVITPSAEFCGNAGSSQSQLGTNGAIGQWQRVSVAYTVTTAGTVCINFNGGTNQVGAINIDAAMITQGTTTPQYADGTSPNWIWNGVANNSTSSGPAL
jgi:prepilin-type N-terminal cleavage/methylation domain-containing protein